MSHVIATHEEVVTTTVVSFRGFCGRFSPSHHRRCSLLQFAAVCCSVVQVWCSAVQCDSRAYFHHITAATASHVVTRQSLLAVCGISDVVTVNVLSFGGFAEDLHTINVATVITAFTCFH